MSGLFRAIPSHEGTRTDPNEVNRLKQPTARRSVASNMFLVFANLMIGITMGSVSIISKAIPSAIDLIAAVISFFPVRQAAKHADDKYLFG